MKNRVFAICLYVAVLLLSVSCHRNEQEDAFVASDAMALTVSGSVVFEYEPNTCQIGCNPATLEFRVHTDTMSDYYIVTLDAWPQNVGQNISGGLRWTSENSINRRENQNFKVVRMEADGRAWLWCQSSKIGVVVQLVED